MRAAELTDVGRLCAAELTVSVVADRLQAS